MRQADPRMPRSARLSPRRRRLLTVAPVLLAVLGACASDKPQSVLEPRGRVAEQLNNLFTPVFLIATFIFLVVEGAVIYVVWRFRARGSDDAPTQIHGNARLELTWTVIPALILAVVGVFTVGTVFDINRRAEGAEVLRVDVVGHQWWWEFSYPGSGVRTANELHIPAGTNVQLKMTSADVIHSFWPPKLAGKLDVIPGRFNYMQIETDKPGRYLGQCAEYCGLSHTNMRLAVVVQEPADFAAWLANQKKAAATPSGELAAAGEQLFIQRGCGGCHTIKGLDGANGRFGPNLTHLASREVFAGAIFDLNDKNLRKWLRDPPGMKPMKPDNGMGMPNLNLSEDDITKLIAYLETLK